MMLPSHRSLDATLGIFPQEPHQTVIYHDAAWPLSKGFRVNSSVTMATHRSPPLTHTTSGTIQQTLLMGLLVLAMVVRGLIPTGYMPGSAQNDLGLFSFEICTTDNSVKTVLLNLSADDAGPSDTNDAQAMQACVFAGLIHPFVTSSNHALSAAHAFHSDMAPGSAYRSAHLPFFAGFPLGSRAPPVL